MIIVPDTLAQKDGLSPKSKLLNLISKLKANTEAPKEMAMIKARLLGWGSSFKLPLTMIGSIGKAQGAKAVKNPEIKLSKIKTI